MCGAGYWKRSLVLLNRPFPSTTLKEDYQVRRKTSPLGMASGQTSHVKSTDVKPQVTFAETFETPASKT